MKLAINITLLFALAIAIAMVGVDAGGQRDTLEVMEQNQERVVEKRHAHHSPTAGRVPRVPPPPPQRGHQQPPHGHRG
ncbi:hypothetical protein M514_09128 [Trichuris suis]|uniref:Uncharacterized protein n=1 Tax=Trichuris suis TaxID=68888 RepID=A0A085LYI9_9BILA|nr:hypothetical protein M513_09128 [Trichuris suis]KFD64766.1 hypothetical protein M514_09128 [Trichuris suis]KHJ40989.1 hypothetical protein D918_08996 [Trichuris suis]